MHSEIEQVSKWMADDWSQVLTVAVGAYSKRRKTNYPCDNVMDQNQGHQYELMINLKQIQMTTYRKDYRYVYIHSYYTHIFPYPSK